MRWDAAAAQHVLTFDVDGGGVRRIRCGAVISTAPAYVTAPLVEGLSKSAADALREIRYPRVAAVNVEYPLDAFREPEHGKGPVNGFGHLIPRSAGIRTLGTLYTSSLFPGRMPDPHRVMLLHFMGGDQDPALYGGIDQLSEEELVAATHRDTVRTLLKSSAS